MFPVIHKCKCPALNDVCKVIVACPPHAISNIFKDVILII